MHLRIKPINHMHLEHSYEEEIVNFMTPGSGVLGREPDVM